MLILVFMFRVKRVQQREESVGEVQQTIGSLESCGSPTSPVAKYDKVSLDKEEMAVSISDTAADTEATSVRKGRQSRVEWLPCSESLAAMEVFRSEVSRVYGLIDCGKLKVDKRSFPRELDVALLSLDKAIKKQQPDVSVK